MWNWPRCSVPSEGKGVDNLLVRVLRPADGEEPVSPDDGPGCVAITNREGTLMIVCFVAIRLTRVHFILIKPF